MNNLFPTNEINPIRAALIEFGKKIDPTHLMTFNFHDQYSLQTAEQRLRRWYIDVMRRLFGRHCFHLPRHDVIEFVGFPENTLSGNIHFHTAMRVPVSHQLYLLQIAEKRWKRIVPTGTFDIRLIQQTNADFDRIFRYITKQCCSTQVIHSAMFTYS